MGLFECGDGAFGAEGGDQDRIDVLAGVGLDELEFGIGFVVAVAF